jgi:hypothetical protein
LGGGSEIIVDTELHRTRWWILIPVTVMGQETIMMVLDTGSLLSAISEPTRQTLVAKGILDASSARLFVLRDVTIQDQQISDLTVRLSPRVTQVGAAGILGLDFLGRFSDIHFHVPTMRLTLTYPSTAE